MEKINRGDIFYADLSPVRGSEQDGVRPVLCIQNDTGNLHSPTIIVAAMTSRRTKNKLPTHVTVCTKGLKKKSIVLLEQIRTIDKSRLEKFVGTVDESDMEKIDQALLISIGLN